MEIGLEQLIATVVILGTLSGTLWGVWRLGRRLWRASAASRLRIALLAALPAVVGASFGYWSHPAFELAAGLASVMFIVLLGLCCLVGVVVRLPKGTRAFFGTLPFEVAGSMMVGFLIGGSVAPLFM